MGDIRDKFRGKRPDNLTEEEVEELQGMPEEEFLRHVRHMAENKESDPRWER